MYYLEKLTGLHGNVWRPHYIGRLEARSTGTAVVGRVGVSRVTKLYTLMMCLGSLLFMLLGIVSGGVPLAIGGGCHLVFLGILVPNFCLFMARDEWQELPEILRSIFPAS